MTSNTLIAPCKAIRIPESRKFLTCGIRNPYCEGTTRNKLCKRPVSVILHKRLRPTGAPNDGFLQSTFRYREMHFKRGYLEICICYIILGELESFRNYEGFSIFFPENVRCNLTYHEGENLIFLIPLSITFLNPRILGFLFWTKNSLTWTVKCEKFNFRKSWGIYYIIFKNCTQGLFESSSIFLRWLGKEKIKGDSVRRVQKL